MRKTLLSAAAQCYHLEFALEQGAPVEFTPGQFLSLVAEAAAGKTYTRAYSLASAPGGPRFDLCVNRVDAGFFSNFLCNLRVGETIQWHGPHGLFTLRAPLSDSLFVAAGTGIAPFRGFLEWLFPDTGDNRSQGRAYWLIYEADRPDELFYDGELRALAEQHENLHYLPVHGAQRAQAIAQVSAELGVRTEPAQPDSGDPNQPNAYLCGLSGFVKSTRTQLRALGWDKQQIASERYD